jgi:ABC-2 type transport system ATP-binding protein
VSAQNGAAIEIAGLTKSFGRAKALDGLDLMVESGQVHGFFGPNGSGKTTTSGLDPLMEAQFQQCIHQVKDEGRTVLLSSHILAEVEALCDRVSIIRLGRTVESGTLRELRHLTRTSIAVETAQPLTGIDALAGVHDLVLEDHHARFDVDTAELDTVVRRLAPLGVRSLTSTPPTLEEMFLRHYGDDETSAAKAAAS